MYSNATCWLAFAIAKKRDGFLAREFERKDLSMEWSLSPIGIVCL